jgi:hypothetical protein
MSDETKRKLSEAQRAKLVGRLTKTEARLQRLALRRARNLALRLDEIYTDEDDIDDKKDVEVVILWRASSTSEDADAQLDIAELGQDALAERVVADEAMHDVRVRRVHSSLRPGMIWRASKCKFNY